MTRKKVAVSFVVGIVFLTVGFVMGQMVQAVGDIPGSSDDPLVSQSYVEKTVGEKVSGIQTSIDEINAQIQAMKEELASLSGNGSSASPVSSQPEQGDSESSSPGGQEVVVTASSANVRVGPGTSYERVETLLNGDTAQYLEAENGWVKIKLESGKTGWTADWLVTMK